MEEKVTVHSRSREIAEAAEQGRWRVTRHHGVDCVQGHDVLALFDFADDWFAEKNAEATARHVAHNHPARVLAMLDVVEAAETVVDEMIDIGPHGPDLVDALARLRVINEADDA
jgi:hypothetical protein